MVFPHENAGCSSSLVSLRGFRTECRGVEIKPEPRPDLPPLGLFKFFSDFHMGRGLTTLTRAVSGEEQIYSGNLEI